MKNKQRFLSRSGKPGQLAAGTPYLMVLPSLFLFVLCYIFPIGYMLYLSLFKWDMLTEMKFVGLKNYATLFRKEEFLQVLGNTFTFTFITVGIMQTW